MKKGNYLTFEDFFARIENSNYCGNKKLIDLGQGNPKIEIPKEVMEIFYDFFKRKESHKYSKNVYVDELKKSICNFYNHRFSVDIDIENIGVFNGSKKIMYLLFYTLLNSDSKVLLLDPAYPDYENITLSITKNIIKHSVDNDLPNINKIEDIVKEQDIDLIICNYPNNPTGVVSNKTFWKELSKIAKDYDVFVINDFTYSDYIFNDFQSPSLLEVFDNDRLIEIYSFSKNFTMPGWRISSVVASDEVIKKITKKNNLMEIGIFTPIIRTLNYILRNYRSFVNTKIYRDNMEYFRKQLSQFKDWEVNNPKSGMFLWVNIGSRDSWDYFQELLDNNNIIITPGVLYGEKYKKFIRISLNTTFEEIDELVARLSVD